MNIAAFVHFYPPYRMAGSETMLHTMLVALVNAGHEVIVVTTHLPDAPDEFEIDGVRCFSYGSPLQAASAVRHMQPDIVITQHDNSALAIDVARGLGVPSVFLMHNDFPLNRQLLAKRPDLVVFNSRWISEQYASTVNNYLVVHPPVQADKHATTPGDCVTLVNLNENKGAGLFYELARRLPDTPFLGVVGGHGNQMRYSRPNLEIVSQTTDMRGDVWSRTRVLLMPSIYESYGMVGIEACASGIPVIAHPTPGLRESLSYAGTFVSRDDPHSWEQHIRRLFGKEAWLKASKRALKRSTVLDPSHELQEWVRAVTEVIYGPLGVR